MAAGTRDHDPRPRRARRVVQAVLSLSVDVARWYSPDGRDTPGAGEPVRRTGAADGRRPGGPRELTGTEHPQNAPRTQ